MTGWSDSADVGVALASSATFNGDCGLGEVPSLRGCILDDENKTYLEQAISDGHAEIAIEGKTERIRYVAADRSERWSDPEEKVRAEFWAGIDSQISVPRPTHRVRGQSSQTLVFECKRADISDAEFTQSIEQACGNRANLSAQFCGTIAGLTRRLLRFDKFPPLERDKNHLTDIPTRYGKPPEWRFPLANSANSFS